MADENKKTDEKEEKEIVENKVKKEIIKDIEKGGVSEKIAEKEEKIAEKIEEKEEKKKEPKKPKKTEAVVKGKTLPISTKKSSAVCKFIKGKNIQKAISDLEQVLAYKKVIPMKGEIPHKKGKRISSGGYPKKAAEHFIKLLKSLQANANVNGLEEPIIVEAISNIASRPYGRFGRVRRKRTNVQIKVRQKAEPLANSSESRVKGKKHNGRKKRS